MMIFVAAKSPCTTTVASDERQSAAGARTEYAGAASSAQTVGHRHQYASHIIRRSKPARDVTRRASALHPT